MLVRLVSEMMIAAAHGDDLRPPLNLLVGQRFNGGGEFYAVRDEDDADHGAKRSNPVKGACNRLFPL